MDGKRLREMGLSLIYLHVSEQCCVLLVAFGNDLLELQNLCILNFSFGSGCFLE